MPAARFNTSQTKRKQTANNPAVYCVRNEGKATAASQQNQEVTDMSEYHLKPGKLGEKVIDACKGIEEKFVDTFLEEDGSLKTGGMADKVTGTYQKVEDTVVGGYKKVEDTVVGGYKKIETAFVDTFLEQDDGANH